MKKLILILLFAGCGKEFETPTCYTCTKDDITDTICTGVSYLPTEQALKDYISTLRNDGTTCIKDD